MSLSPLERAGGLRTVREYQSEIAEFRESPEPFVARITAYVLAAMALSLLSVLTFLDVDVIVSTDSGIVVSTAPQVVVQAFDPSIIKTLNVTQGQRVAKGQLLATLDPVFAQASIDQLKAQSHQYEAQIARDTAEISGKPLLFPPNDDPEIARYQKIQKDFYDQQIAQLNATLNSFDQKIELTKTTIAKYEIDAKRYQEHADIAQQIDAMQVKLEQHGAGSLRNRLQTTDALVEEQRLLEFDRNTVTENQHTLASLRADRESAVQQFLAVASQDLATTQTQLASTQAQLDAAARHKDLVKITAEEDSFVTNVASLSVGAVLKQGDQLMTLSPIRTEMAVDLKLSPRDVGFVHKGEKVVLKLDAFNYIEHGTVDGTVLWVGESSISTDQAVGQPLNAVQAQPNAAENGAMQNAMTAAYYKARVRIDAYHLAAVPPDTKVAPGMTLTADIKVGKRSLGVYIFSGLMHMGAEAFREP